MHPQCWMDVFYASLYHAPTPPPPSFLKLINELSQILLVRIHPNLRSAVYCSAMAAGDEEEWEFGWSQFKNATVASEASKLMSALACTSKTQLLERCASWANAVVALAKEMGLYLWQRYNPISKNFVTRCKA